MSKTIRLTEGQLRQIIRESLDQFSDWSLDPNIQKMYKLQKMLRFDRVYKEVARSSAYQKGHHPGYSINNGNIVVVDSEGQIYYSPAIADGRADVNGLFEYLHKEGVPDRGYIVPTP